MTIHSTRLHLVLYSFLLVFTPFLLLQNYLVDLVSDISRATANVGGVSVPVVPVVAGAVLLAAAAALWRRITRRFLLAAAILVLMDAVAQQITDYYFGHRFYDLQQNWHYIAYGIFAFMAYRDLAPRGLSLVRILWLTWLCALGFSLFDEIFQMRISSRVFDLSDTSKDLWGCLMGMVLVHLGGRHADDLRRGWARSPRPRVHITSALTSLALMVVFTFVFLCVTALLSDPPYVWIATGITLAACALAYGVFCLLFLRWGRIGLAAFAVAALAHVGYGALRHPDTPIGENRYGLTVYRGIPIPFFDVMLRSDGGLRLVDKKHYFNPRDQQFLLRQGYDIIIIGSGREGLGGLGFPERSAVQFVYNPGLDRPTQVITLRTPEACDLFNRLAREHKRVLFILHNTC